MRDPGALFVNGRVFPTGAVGGRGEDWLWVPPRGEFAAGCGAPPVVDARIVDLGGRMLVPAFADAHIHWSWLATALLGPDLGPCGSRADVLERVAAWRGPGRGAHGDWVVGTGFDETTWGDATLPTRADLDRIESRRPVLLQRVCGHVGILNSVALAHVPHGVHTAADSGRMAEDDLYAVYDLVRPNAGALAAIVPRVVEQLHAHGITAVHDVSTPEMVQAFALAAAQGTLDVRVTCSIPARSLDFGTPARPHDARSHDARPHDARSHDTRPHDARSHDARPHDARSHDTRPHDAVADGAASFLAAHGLPDLPAGSVHDAYEVVGIKLFMDGSLGARTACLRHPYADAPGVRGTALYGNAEIQHIFRTVDAAGLQLMVHAIGDAALDQALDALEPVVRSGNPLRHRLEHVEVTPPDLVERLARSGLWVCAQPNFAGRWSQPGGMNEQRLGSRLGHCNLYGTLQAAGIPMAFGSDCMPLGALYGLQSARQHPIAGERLDATTALYLYTASARAITVRGAAHQVSPSRDWIVVDGDFAGVAATFRGGRPVFASPGFRRT